MSIEKQIFIKKKSIHTTADWHAHNRNLHRATFYHTMFMRTCYVNFGEFSMVKLAMKYIYKIAHRDKFR